MISINTTLFMQVIHFLLLVFIMNRLMFRPILKMIEDRMHYVEETKSKLVNIEEETADLIEKYASMEKDARKEAGNESSRLKKEAAVTAEKIFNDTRNEISLIRERVGKEIEERLTKAKLSLEQEAEILADAITEKFAGRRIDS